jgi:Lrp/AsnC family transcriptional regulator
MIKTSSSLDRIDRQLLALLQRNAALSVAELAEQVGLSTTPCWRRIRNLEKRGVIRERVALLDRQSLNVDVDVFVSIRTNRHDTEWFEGFSSAVAQMPEVLELYRMSGDVDYVLRVVVPDIAAYDAFYKRLIDAWEIADVSSSFAMERIKYTTALPLGYV